MSSLWVGKQISAGYGTMEVLKDISLEVSSSEIVAVLGVNGAGKSSLLKLMLGLLSPSQGSAEILGTNLSTFPAHKRRGALSLLEAHPYCTFPITVDDLIDLSQRHEDPEIKEHAIALTGVEPLLDKNVLELSSGELKRAFIAHLLTQNTDIMMADEIFANLDWSFKTKLAKGLKEWRDKYKKTFVLALHDLDLVRNLADRIVLLERGRIVHLGTPEETLQSPHFEACFGVKFKDLYAGF